MAGQWWCLDKQDDSLVLAALLTVKHKRERTREHMLRCDMAPHPVPFSDFDSLCVKLLVGTSSSVWPNGKMDSNTWKSQHTVNTGERCAEVHGVSAGQVKAFEIVSQLASS